MLDSQVLSRNYANEISNANWKKYVYVKHGSIASIDHCSAFCFFDGPNKCHYFYFEGSTCYLGDFTTTNPISSIDRGDNFQVKIPKGEYCIDQFIIWSIIIFLKLISKLISKLYKC